MNTREQTSAQMMMKSITNYDNVFCPKVYGNIIFNNYILSNLELTLKQEDELKPVGELQSVSDCFMNMKQTALSANSDYIMKLLEDLLIFVRSLSRANSHGDYLTAVIIFAKLRTSKALTSILLEQWQNIFGAHLQSDDDCENSFTKLRSILDDYDRIKNLPVFKKLYKFLMYCIGTSLFEEVGIKFDFSRFLLVEKAAVKKQFQLGPDFLHCMLDTTLFICETGYQCMKTGSLSPIYHHETAYMKWYKETETIKLQSRYLSNPEPHGFTIFDFLNRLESCIEKGTAISKCKIKGDDSDGWSYYIVNKTVQELKLIKSDCLTRRLAQQERKAPFAVLISAGSSVGKSTFTKLLFYHYAKVFDLPCDDEYRYVRNSFDQYWTNFNSSQWFVQLDDIAYLHPNKATTCDPSLVEMLMVVNNVPYVPTQADLADKGKTPLRAKFVVATTNTQGLNANEYFSCPFAVQRRLPYIIELIPKPQYAKHGCMLDSSNLPTINEGDYPDFWTIVIKRIVPARKERSTHMGQTSDVEILRYFDSIFDFLEWFNDVAKEAASVQDESARCDATMKKMILCEHKMPSQHCAKCKLKDEVQIYHDEIGSLQTARDISYTPEVGNMFDHDLVEYTTPWTERVSERLREQQQQEEIDAFEKLEQRYKNSFGSDCHSQRYRAWFLEPLLKQFEQMNIFNRLIVLLFYGLNALDFRYPGIMMFLFGRYYFYYFCFQVSHIPQAQYFFYKMLGRRAYYNLSDNKGKIIILGSAIGIAISMYASYKFILDFKKGCTQIRDDFKKGYDEQMEKISAAKKALEEEEKKLSEMQEPNADLQGASHSLGVKPESKGDKQENVWYKDVYECSPFDVTPPTLSRKDWSIKDLEEQILNNIVHFTIKVRTPENIVLEQRTGGICLGGTWYVANSHAFKWETFELTVTQQTSKDGINRNVTFLIAPSQFFRDLMSDLIFINLPIPPKKNLYSYFAKSSYQGRFDAYYISRDRDGSIKRNLCRATELLAEYSYMAEGLKVPIKCNIWKTKPEIVTVAGDCGAVLVTKTAFGPVILGIHVLGFLDGTAGAISITHEKISGLKAFSVGSTAPTLQIENYKFELTELHKKSPVRYIEDGTAQVYGSFVGFRSKKHSEVGKTFISDEMVARGYKRETYPPVMNGWLPWHQALKEMVRPVSYMNADILIKCKMALFSEIVDNISDEDLKELHVYDDNTALNGAPGVAYVDKINRNTSAGFPFKKSKKTFFRSY